MARWLIALVLVGCGPSQHEICDRLVDHARDECMTKKWTEKQADCVMRTGYGSMQSLFCFDN